MRRWTLAVFLLMAATGGAADEPSTTTVTVLDIKGAIGPATTDYLRRGFADAARRSDAAVVIRMDTPGGLDLATRDINQAILAAEVPVVTYVWPEGARAASAGTYILYASHVAAMAPATNLGAATPVQIGGMSPGEAEDEEEGAQPGDAENEDTTARRGTAMERKVINDSVAYIRGLAERRDRNADWAERAVREAASLTATDALELGVIEVIATDLDDLLAQIDGMEAQLPGSTVTLATAGASTRIQEPDWRNKLLARITDPTIAYLLFIIGLYGLLLEGYNPGVLVPGIVGAISLILALYAFQVLPINYAGVALIVLGIILMVAEAFAPSFGALGIGGVIALVFGSIILIDSDVPGIEVPRGIIATVAGISGLLFLAITLVALRSRFQPVVSGREGLIGAEAVVIDDFRGIGRVHLFGEDWRAASDVPLRAGERVRVVEKDGLTLKVIKIEGDAP